MIKIIRNLLYEVNIKNLDVDSDELIDAHKKNIEKKILLRSAYLYFYKKMQRLSRKYFFVDGHEIELGSGISFFKEIHPKLKTSDIRNVKGLDYYLDAQAMEPIKNNSVRIIYAVNVLHHLPDPNQFFNELVRVLKKGGGCIIIEPHNGLFSRLIHKYLHKDESYDTEGSWENNHINGPLSGANQALSYIIFERDKEKFEKMYGHDLEVINKSYNLNGLRFFLSGGLNFIQLVPSFMNKPIQFFEKILAPIAKHWTLTRTIVIRKK